MDEIKVGDGVTWHIGSDRYPYTVIEVVGNFLLKIQEDTAVRTDSNGFSEQQEYEFKPNPEGTVKVITRRNNGRWHERGRDKTRGDVYTIGERLRYDNPSH